MSQNPLGLSNVQLTDRAELAGRWPRDVALAAAVGGAYLLVAQIIVWGLAFQPDKAALFWPPAGISSGMLIALGPRWQWPAVAGIVVAEAIAAQLSWHTLWITAIMAACDPVEALTVAWLIERYFGPEFSLERTRNVAGFLAAAVVAAIAPSLVMSLAKQLLLGPSIMFVPTWQHWFAGDVLGIVTVAPIVIGIANALRHPPSRKEYVEGTFALLSLAVVTSIIISLPREPWDVLLPVTWPFPILVWLAARSRPVFAAAGAFLVSNIIVWTTNFGIGHFGNARSPLSNRVLEAQTSILFLAVSAYFLAALFAERRKSEALLTRSNALLERERNNKLMNTEATSAAIAHELKQPLAAMVANADASLEFLEHTPPDIAQAKEALNDIVSDGHHASDALDGLRTLFRNVERTREQIDVNELAREVLHSMRGELNGCGITLQSELGPEIPVMQGNRGQLQQVIFNLAHNAVEAMADMSSRNRVLRLVTQLQDRDRIVVEMQDTGPGIDPKRIDSIFDAFVTTKPQGTGLGLAICRIIVEQHGGELNAFSDGKSGALFQFSLPVEPAGEQDKSRALS